MNDLIISILLSLIGAISIALLLLTLFKIFGEKKLQTRRALVLARQVGSANISDKVEKGISELNSQVIRIGDLLVQDKYKSRLRDLSSQLGSNAEQRLTSIISRKIYFALIGALISLILVAQGKLILILPTLALTFLASFLPNSYVFVTRLLKGKYGKRLDDLARTSGTKWLVPEKLIVAKIVSSFVVFGIAYFFLLFQSSSWSGISYLPLSLVVGFFIPDVILYNKVIKRREEFEDSFPDAIDLLSLCVNAGLAFPAALAKVSEIQKGPVPEEFLRVRTEVQLGKERNEALREMADRMKVPALKNFVNAVGQVDRFGIPISSALAEQSRELRADRKAKGREKAQKVPIKILGPVMLCFLPCVLLIVLGPAVIGIIGAF